MAGQAELIIDYAAARLRREAQYRRRRPKAPCNGCFIAGWPQIWQMRWSPRKPHMMLKKVRTAVANGTASSETTRCS